MSETAVLGEEVVFRKSSGVITSVLVRFLVKDLASFFLKKQPLCFAEIVFKAQNEVVLEV